MDSKQTKFVNSVLEHVNDKDKNKAETLLVDALENKKSAQAKAPATKSEALSVLQGLFTDDSGGEASSGGNVLSSLVGGLLGGNSNDSASSGGGDILSSLVGGLFGGDADADKKDESTSSSGGDMLSSLLGSVLGGAGADSKKEAASESTGILGNLVGILPSLLKLIKPEHLTEVKNLVLKFLK